MTKISLHFICNIFNRLKQGFIICVKLCSKTTYKYCEINFLNLRFCDFNRGAWQISEADRQYLEAEYDDYNSTNASGAAFCRSVVLIVSFQTP